MPPVNDFLPFASGGGANVETQSAYAADPLLPIGNQPGIATSAFNNKAIRQANAVASTVGQFLADQTNTDVKDDAIAAKLLAQFNAAVAFRVPIITDLTASTTWKRSYYFGIASGSATAGATYTNNTFTFTVSKTVASGTLLLATGDGAPTASGTLTKASGAGDATITFYAVRASLYIEIDGVGGGGGGSGSGNSGQGVGGNGTNTTIGGTLIVFPGGVGGNVTAAGTGGIAPTIGAGVTGFGTVGGGASGGGFQGTANDQMSGGIGGSSIFGGAGIAGGGANGTGTNGGDAAANSGSGGGGAGGGTTASTSSGAGGGAGAGARGLIISADSVAFAATYAVIIGAGGAAGTAGSNGTPGGAGAGGRVRFKEYFQ